MSEVVRQIISWASAFLGSALGGAIIGGLIGGIIKGKVEKMVSKNNIEKIAKDTVESTIGQVKAVSFKQSIQPVVESELEKVNEKADIRLRKQVRKLENQNEKIINILEKFIAYFDYSIGVPEKVKEDAKVAIKEAKEEEKVVVEEQNFDIEVKVEKEEPKIEDKVENKAKNNLVR